MLPVVRIDPQVGAGGLFGQFDCSEETLSSLSRFHVARGTPGVVYRTVRECEIWMGLHGDPADDGEAVETVVACAAFCGMPARAIWEGISACPTRGHHSIPLVWSTAAGIPDPNGGHGHFVLNLGDGHYGNPANGVDDSSSPSLAAAYRGRSVEILIPVGGDDVALSWDFWAAQACQMELNALGRTREGDLITGSSPARSYTVDLANRLNANQGATANEEWHALRNTPEGIAWQKMLTALKAADPATIGHGGAGGVTSAQVGDIIASVMRGAAAAADATP